MADKVDPELIRMAIACSVEISELGPLVAVVEAHVNDLAASDLVWNTMLGSASGMLNTPQRLDLADQIAQMLDACQADER